MSNMPTLPPYPPAPRSPFLLAAIVMLCLCASGGYFGFIGYGTLSLPWYADGWQWVQLPAGRFMSLFALTWALCLVMLLLYPRNLSTRTSSCLILTLALLCRLLLLPHPVSDDVNRYLWEGRVLAAGYSPYVHAPDSPELSALANNDLWQPRVNHPEFTAVYPPLPLYLFRGLYELNRWLPGAYTPTAIKWLMIFFDLGTIAFLLALLRQRDRSPRWVILYAFNPVILYSFAGQAHFDVLQIFFCVGSLYFYGERRWGWMFLFVGFAVLTKFIPIILLPFFLRRDNWRWGAIALAAIVLPYLPFLQTDGLAVFAGIRKFSGELAVNGAIHTLLRETLGSIETATLICRILLGSILLLGYWHFHPERGARYRNDPVSGCFFALGAFLLFAPTLHFWYLSWIIPCLVLRPTASWMLLSLTIAGYFIANGFAHDDGVWRIPNWMYLVEWVPFYLLLLRDAYLFFRRVRFTPDKVIPKSVSIVIPVRNEADNIGDCLACLRLDEAVGEIIVVDGGSTDETVANAQAAGATVVTHLNPIDNGGGRGGQIHAGIMAATGDVVAIVHADSRVPPDTCARILRILSKEPNAAGGAVGAVFAAPGWRLRLLEYLNDFRMVCLGISFGDQVQFFRRRQIVENDLFPAIPLMEDVEFSLRLHRAGRQVFLYGNVLASARRWQAAGYGRSLTVIRLVAVYLWQRLRGTPDTLAMYRCYYEQKK